jgi:hypothetical protein
MAQKSDSPAAPPALKSAYDPSWRFFKVGMVLLLLLVVVSTDVYYVLGRYYG